MSRRSFGLAAVLSVAMAMSTFTLFALAVAASDLQDEFGLSKFQLGLVGAVNTAAGGLFAPVAGAISDRIGGRRSVAGVLVLSSITTAITALSQSYMFLLISMAIQGVPQGWGNPATNRAIADGIPLSERGIVTGIKQSGVQVATFSAGFGIPVVSAAWGWRSGLWIAAAVSLIATFGVVLITELPELKRSKHDRSVASSALPPFVYQVAVFGFLLGTVGGGLGRFLPLFAEESVGFSVETAGIVFGVSGLVAIPSRIGWGIALDRGFPTRRALVILGIGAALSCAILISSAGGQDSLLWIGTVVSGLTIGSWNTPANVAMISETGPNEAGKATGILLFGFLIGLTLGGPAVGLSIDTFGRYEPAWIVSGLLCGAGVAAVARRLSTPREVEESD